MMMKNRFLAALAAALMACWLLPAPALAAVTSVYVGGTQVSGYWKDNGAGGIEHATADDYTVYYATPGGTPTLTLRNAHITKYFSVPDFICGIRAHGDLHLVLEGSNLIEPTDPHSSQPFCGIWIGGDLTVSGTGSLTAVTPGTIATTPSAREGIYAQGLITVNGGSIEGIGGASTGSARSYGVRAGGGVTVNAGSLTGISNGSAVGNSYGVYSEGPITVNGGKLTGNGGSNSRVSRGVSADTLLTVNGGTLIGSSGTLAEPVGTGAASHGLYANTISLQGGDTTASTSSSSGTFGSVNSVPSVGARNQWKTSQAGSYQLPPVSSSAPSEGYLRVTSDKPTITTTALPDGLANAPYTTTLAATTLPDSAAVIWELDGGTALPAGLSLSDGGVISGTPSAAVTAHPITVKATNSSGSATATLYLTVTPMRVAYQALAAADGSDVQTTTALTLTFQRDVPGLSAGDITLNGATKGALTRQSAGVYRLGISDITVGDNGLVSVAVAKSGYVFTPASMDAAVREHTPLSISIAPVNAFVQGNAPGNLIITVDKPGQPPRLSDFDNLEISAGGSPFAPFVTWGYWAYEGSIHLEMFKIYLDTLAPGTYTLRVNLKGNYPGQSLTTQMTVTAPPVPGAGGGTGADVPQTGDPAAPGLWMLGLLAAGAGLGGFGVAGRRRRSRRRRAEGI